MSEAGAGVVISAPSNGEAGVPRLLTEVEGNTRGGESVEETSGLPGVVGRACGEGCSEEDGRSRKELGGEAESRSPPTEGTGAIRETPETLSGAFREVGGARSSAEAG